MNLYFLSDVESHIKIDGEYAGKAHLNLLKFQSHSLPNLVEFLPENDAYLPSYGNENSNLLRKFKTPDGYLYFPLFQRRNDGAFKVIFQNVYHTFNGDVTLTVVNDLGVKFYLDGALYHVLSLPFTPDFTNVEITGDFLVVSFKKEKTALFIYSISNKTLLFSDLIDEYFLTDTLTVKKAYAVTTKTTVIERWELSSSFKLKSVTDEKQKPFDCIHPILIPLAFFENAVIGASTKEITTPAFNSKSSSLREFLGNVKHAVFSPINANSIWLIGEKTITDATLVYENGLIDNVILDDF